MALDVMADADVTPVNESVIHRAPKSVDMSSRLGPACPGLPSMTTTLVGPVQARLVNGVPPPDTVVVA
jgi:hypothetical protein